MNTYVLFTNRHHLVDACLHIGRVAAVVCERARFSLEVNDICALNKIPLLKADPGADIDHGALAEKGGDADLFAIAHHFSLIFDGAAISRYPRGIWNVHTGKLPDNRGRHPVSWSLLNNDFYTALSLHEIDERIDQGFLLAERIIPIRFSDDGNSITRKMNKALDGDFILEAMARYRHGGKTALERGRYNKNLMGRLDVLDPEQMDSSFVYGAFRAQRAYGGIMFNGVRYEHCHFFDDSLSSRLNGGVIITCRDGIRLALE